MSKKLMFVVNVDWFFMSHRLPIALEAMRQGYEVHIATGLTDQKELMDAHGLIVHSLMIDRSSANPFNMLRTLFQIFALFRNVKPDLVHLVTIKPVLLGGIASRLAGVPAVVAAISGLGYVFLDRGGLSKVRRKVVSVLYCLALGHPNIKVIFQNPNDRDAIQSATALSASQVILIRGSGVDLELINVKPLPNRTPVVMLASRLIADKGVREFIIAAKLLRQSGQNARFCLVGSIDPSNPSSLTEEELEASRAEGVIECWGHRVDMAKVLSEAHIVVLPSYREGLPKVLLEAAAAGRAVVTTDVPGCRDAIEPNVTGILVPARDAESLKCAIQELLDNPKKCTAMGRSGRTLAEREFDVRMVVQKHLQIYCELLKSQL